MTKKPFISKSQRGRIGSTCYMNGKRGERKGLDAFSKKRYNGNISNDGGRDKGRGG